MRRLVLFSVVWTMLSSPAQAAAANPEDVSARLLVSNPAPYVGEEIDLTFEVRYRRYPGGRARLTWPRNDRVLASDPALSRSSRRRAADGVIIETLQRRLQPLQPGPLILHGARLSFGHLEVPVTPVSLHIRPLPQRSQPDGFTDLVGEYRLQLQAEGTGAREILVTVSDSGMLGPPPQPQLAIGASDRLVLIDSDSQPAADNGRTYLWRYYYLPHDEAAAPLQARLVFYNPVENRYRLLRAGAVPVAAAKTTARLSLAWLGLLAVGLIALAAAWHLRPCRVDAQLKRLLGNSPQAMSRREMLARLEEHLDRQTAAALRAWWQQSDRRWSGDDTSPSASAADRQLCRRLRKTIDKKMRIPYRDRTR